MNTHLTVNEVRYYNGFNNNIIKCVFLTDKTTGENLYRIENGLNDDGTPVEFTENWAGVLKTFYPQIIEDVTQDPVNGWNLKNLYQ